MTLGELLALMLAVWGAHFVWSNLKAREAANAAIRDTCQAERLLFLDDTVGLESVWFARDENGRLRMRRVYGFEFSDTGHDRRRGTVTMFGDTVSTVNVGPRLVRDDELLH
jgi:hypothetical protein